MSSITALTSILLMLLLYYVSFSIFITPSMLLIPDTEIKDPKYLNVYELSISLVLVPCLFYKNRSRFLAVLSFLSSSKLYLRVTVSLLILLITLVTATITHYKTSCDGWISTDVGYIQGKNNYGLNMMTVCNGRVWEPHVASAIEDYLWGQGHAIDVGAFMGYHTLRLAKAAAPFQVYAFEGRRGVIEKLLQPNLIRNNAQHAVQIQQETIGLDWELDSLLEEKWMKEPVALMKIDCEGCEMAFLKGTRRVIEQWHPVLIIEIQDDQSRREQEHRIGGQQLIRPIGNKDDTIQLIQDMGYGVVNPLLDRYSRPTWDYIALKN